MLDIVREACNPVCNVLHLLQDWQAHLVHAPAKWTAVRCQKCKMFKGRGWISWLFNAWKCNNWKIISSVAYSGRLQNYLYSTVFGVSGISLPSSLVHSCLSQQWAEVYCHRVLLSLSLRCTIRHPVFPLESPCLLFQIYHFSARSHGYPAELGFFKPRNQTNEKILGAWCIQLKQGKLETAPSFLPC